jgi:hypothetical protein
MSEILPTDLFSRRRRQLGDNPGALGAGSTVHTADFYGNAETWVVETFRVEDGSHIAFLQRSAAEGGLRLVLPEAVMAVLSRHRDQLSTRAKRQQGHRLIALRKQRGDKLGNPDVLKQARCRRKAAPR